MCRSQGLAELGSRHYRRFVAPEETPVERLTLLENVHHLYFEPPLFLQTGESFWVEGRSLFVRGVNGQVRSQEARPSRPTDAR